MKKNIVMLVMFFAAGLSLTFFGCGASSTTALPTGAAATSTTASPAIDGAALYATDCQPCHGPLATTDKKGSTASMIRFGITNDLGGMGQFASLSPDQIQALVSVLSATAMSTTTTTSSSSGSIDGAALYNTNCSSCHGPLAASSKANATVSMIQSGIASNYGGMGQFSTLTAAQIQAIATALSSAPTTTTPPTGTIDGATLYASDCQSCHGPLATSSKANASVAMIQTGISTVGAMGQFSTLTSAQIQAIATALMSAPTATTPTTGTIDGAALYAADCQSCHGPLATSSKKNATVAKIQTGISSVGAMGQFSTLTSAQIQAIATALSSAPTTSTPPPVTSDGATLYASDCQSCHGPLATSSKAGATAAMIQTGISTVSAMNQFSTLTTTQIQAIAAALATGGTTTTTVITDGPTLYSMNCSGCHGALARSSVSGSSSSEIRSAISSVRQMSALPNITSLTLTQIQAIATALK